MSRRFQNQSSENDKAGRRLFVVGNKTLTEQEYRDAFEPYGNVEDLYVLQKGSEAKGIVYVTYEKVSQAALAIEELNGKKIGEGKKLIKVIVASDKKGDKTSDENEDEKYHRLFVMMREKDTEETIREIFSQYGRIEDIILIKNKRLCFVRFHSRYSCALALEKVDKEFRAMFAEPRGSQRKEERRFDDLDRGVKRSRYDGSDGHSGGRDGGRDDYYDRSSSSRYDRYDSYDRMDRRESNNSYDRARISYGAYDPAPNRGLLSHQPPVSVSNSIADCVIHVTISTMVPEVNFRRLFDIVPGMCNVKHTPGSGTALIRYAAPEYANYAVEKLDGFEYPPGQCLVVRLSDPTRDSDQSNADQLQRAALILQQAGINPMSVLASESQQHAQITSSGPVERVPYCDFEVPLRQCTKPPNTPTAKRLFIICQPEIAVSYLKDLFCRFGDLIEVHMVRNRNIGYVKYASVECANTARDWLHLKEVARALLKVVDAEERENPQSGQNDGGANNKSETWA